MRKKFFIGALALISLSMIGISFHCVSTKDDSLFRENVNALADIKTTEVKGHCEKLQNDCYAECEHCGARYYAEGYKGGSFKMSGTCVACHIEM